MARDRFLPFQTATITTLPVEEGEMPKKKVVIWGGDSKGQAATLVCIETLVS